MNTRRSKARETLSGERLCEYDAMLVDTDHHTLEDVRAWLAGIGVKVTVSMVHRDRKAAVAPLAELRAKRDMAVAMALMAEREGWPVSRLNLELAGQKIFDALTSMGAVAPESASQAIRLLEATASLRAVDAKARLVDLQREQLAAAVGRAKRAAEVKASAAGDGKLTREDVFKILDDIVRGAA